MNVVSSQQMSDLESMAYQQGCSEEDFMEKAGKGIAEVIDNISTQNGYAKNALLLCGKGNNGGDAYVAGRELIKKGYAVTAFQAAPIETCSKLCKIQYEKFISSKGSIQASPVFPKSGFLIDGLFGTGFQGKVKEPYASLIQVANASKLPIISVDIPSGLTNEIETWDDPAIIHAAHTIFLGLPKIHFFLGEGWNYVGKLHSVDFGLPQSIIESSPAEMQMLTADTIKPLLPTIKRTRHKYERGYVIALAGSPPMPGAAILSCTAALRGGAGIVRLFYPKGMECELSSSPAELIKQSFVPEEKEAILDTMNKGSAVIIGPGMGRDSAAKHLFRFLLPKIQKPAVIDADGLSFLAEEEIPLPVSTILTPHKGELERLLKIAPHQKITMDFLRTCQKYADQRQATLLLKGGPTFIFHPGSPLMVNPAGDPGMATAGSGDVLTGLLAALLAQGLSPLHAAMAGVYLHGLAGEEAASHLTSRCIIAGDLIKYFSYAYRLIENY